MLMSVSVPYSHRVLAWAAGPPPPGRAAPGRTPLRMGFSFLLPLGWATFPQRLHSSRQPRHVKNGGNWRLTIGRGLRNETVGCQKLLEEGCGVARVERGLVICGERPLLILGFSRSQPGYDRRLLETKVRVPIDERVDLAALAADDQPNRIAESRLPRRCTE